MSKPEEVKDPTDVVTPDPAAAPEVIAQPEVTELEQQAEIKEQPVVETVPEVSVDDLQKKNDRLKQQLHGREKEIEELRATKIAEIFQDTPAVEEDVYSEDIVEPVKAQPQQSNNIMNQLTVINAIRGNKTDLMETYANDKYVPCTLEVTKEVEAEILKQDPKGTGLLNPTAWRNAYSSIKARKIEERMAEQERATEQIKEAARREVIEKEASKLDASVETSTKPIEASEKPSLTEVTRLLKENKISTDEVKKWYPEIIGYSPIDGRTID